MLKLAEIPTNDLSAQDMITFDDLTSEPVPNLPLKTILDACFDGTKGMHDFSSEGMLPLLKMLLGPSPQEIAIRDTYYRMSLLLRSALVMNSLDHFQSVASLTRTLFELWLDLKILAQDTTGDAIEKYNEFPEIDRYRVAEQLVNFSTKNPQSLRMDITKQREFYADSQRKQRVSSAITGTNGKRNYPKHWTNKNVRQRAVDVGQEPMYMEAYPLLSWYVHAGATGTAGMSEPALEAGFGFCHTLIQRIFVDAISTCAKTTKISRLDYFDDWRRDIELKPRKLIVGEQIALLKRKQALANQLANCGKMNQ